MTARHPLNVGQPDLALSNPSFSLETPSPQTLSVEMKQDTTEMSDAISTLMGGLSGLIFTLSLVFLLQAPLLSGLVLLALASGWGGAAVFKTHQDS